MIGEWAGGPAPCQARPGARRTPESRGIAYLAPSFDCEEGQLANGAGSCSVGIVTEAVVPNPGLVVNVSSAPCA